MSNSQSHHCDNAEDKIIEDVNSVGWSVIMIEATEYLPAFACTIGLWKNYRQPEIISFGLSFKTLHSILNIAGKNIKNGKRYLIDTVNSEFFTKGNSQLISVDERSIPDYFGYAIWFNNGAEFPALQLVWPDRNDKLPWQNGYEEEFIYRQPLLDRNADFKFREAKNLGVFTTRQWLERDKPILHVVHDEEGDWQFLTGDQIPEDAKIVALEQMVLRDNSLNDIFNLDYGERAERDSINGKWKRSKTVFE
ncbi:MAG: DUF4262 domain-containing protein [Taibaiella sp.]|nr:DUF4262 domain-containing protein [Taibaiella sp.]